MREKIEKILKEWYLYVPVVSWGVILVHYLRKRPKLTTFGEKIGENFEDIDLNLKVALGNVCWLIPLTIVNIILKILRSC